MMNHLKINVKIDVMFLEELFNDYISDTKGLKKFQAKTFKIIYMKRVKSLYNILKVRLKKYIVDDGENHFIAEDKGTKKYITAQKEKINTFLYSDEKELNTSQQYIDFKRDKMIKRVYRYTKNKFIRSKEWAIKSALGEGKVVSFFNNLGIIIIVEDDLNADV